MPDADTILATFMVFIAALAVSVAVAGIIYRAIRNVGNDLRRDMNQMETRLQREMSSGFDKLYDTLSRHEHRDDGASTITLATGVQSRFSGTSQR